MPGTKKRFSYSPTTAEKWKKKVHAFTVAQTTLTTSEPTYEPTTAIPTFSPTNNPNRRPTRRPTRRPSRPNRPTGGFKVSVFADMLPIYQRVSEILTML